MVSTAWVSGYLAWVLSVPASIDPSIPACKPRPLHIKHTHPSQAIRGYLAWVLSVPASIDPSIPACKPRPLHIKHTHTHHRPSTGTWQGYSQSPPLLIPAFLCANPANCTPTPPSPPITDHQDIKEHFCFLTFYTFGSWIRMLAVILVSDFSFFWIKRTVLESVV